MFKDIYKAANDDIKPNPYLLTRIINKAEERPKPFFYRHRIAIFAAAVALIIALPGLIHTPEDTAVLKKPILPEAQNDKTYFILSKDTAENAEKSADADITYGEAKLYSETTSTVDDSTSKKGARLENEALSDSHQEMTVVMTVNSIAPVPTAANFTMRASGGSSSVPVTEELTTDMYFDSIGFSPESLSMPETLSPDFSSDKKVTVTKLDGEIVSDENTFSYSGENFLMLTTSTSTESTMSYLNNDQYEKSIFGDKNAVVLYDGSVYEAYTIHSSGTALKIVTDISEEELKSLLISAAE